MKKIFLILATAALSFGSFAGNPDDGKGRGNGDPDKYCAEFKNGVLCVTHNGEIMKKDVHLANGTIVHTDAVVERKNGSVMILKPDQCVNVDGKLEGGKTTTEPMKPAKPMKQKTKSSKNKKK